MIKPVSPKHQTDTTQPEESKGEIQAKSECNPQRKRVSNKILIEDEPIIKPESFIGSSEQLKMFAQDLMNEKAINSLKNIHENHTIINRIPVEMIETSHDT